MTSAVISVRGLRKSYGDFEAVRGIDLTVNAGEVFAFLGPNGAGKTSTVEILEGYRERDGGDVTVLGEDPADAGADWRQRIGIVLQQCRMHPELTVRESLAMFAGYYAQPRSVEETIALVGLEDSAGVRAGRLSGGQQRRLDVGLALVGDPELLFLDEPTTGFDPSARRLAWDVIDGLRRLGKTIFLTTHYMDEAQRLADRLAVISAGQIVATGTPADLGRREQRPATIAFRLPAGTDPGELPGEIAAQVRATVSSATTVNGSAGESSEPGEPELTLDTRTPTQALSVLTGWAAGRGFELDGLSVTRPTLEDIYLDLVSAATIDAANDGAAEELEA